MSKVICDVCGTSYPETSTQCPICGCVRPADAATVTDEGAAVHAAGTYQHVKGGRFSKANVRKRNAGKPAPVHTDFGKTVESTENRKKKSGNTGLVVTIFVLLLAILLVIGYIIFKFFIPVSSGNDVPETDPPVVTEEAAVTTEPDIPCEAVELEEAELLINEIGGQAVIKATVSPADTTDIIEFTPEDESVVTVDNAGNITAVSYGTTVITVKCGAVNKECVVTVEEPFVLDTESVTFNAIGAVQTIYSGTLPLDEITWDTDDEKIAVVADGVVTSVGEGITTVYGKYKNLTLSCDVICEITEETTETTAPDTTQNDVAPGPYTLKNLIGVSSSDVSLGVGESFILALLDANGEKISGVTWTVEDGRSCTVNNGTVKAVASGNCVIVATYNGQTFECTVRVR